MNGRLVSELLDGHIPDQRPNLRRCRNLRLWLSEQRVLSVAEDGEIVIRYGGWSLQELGNSLVVRERKLMPAQDWYHKYPWADEKLAAGIYRLRVPVPNSNRKAFAEQLQSLPPGEQPAPVVLVASALLAHWIQTGEGPLNGDFVRCKEQTADDDRVALYWYDDRLHVNNSWEAHRGVYIWLSSVRTS